MLAFQVSVNEQRVYTVGIGDQGLMDAGVNWARIPQINGNVHEHLWIQARAMNGESKTHHHWQNVAIKVGDEVTINVVEIESADPPLPGMPSYPIQSPR
jgi:hypothetical protein